MTKCVYCGIELNCERQCPISNNENCVCYKCLIDKLYNKESYSCLYRKLLYFYSVGCWSYESESNLKLYLTAKFL